MEKVAPVVSGSLPAIFTFQIFSRSARSDHRVLDQTAEVLVIRVLVIREMIQGPRFSAPQGSVPL